MPLNSHDYSDLPLGFAYRCEIEALQILSPATLSPGVHIAAMPHKNCQLDRQLCYFFFLFRRKIKRGASGAPSSFHSLSARPATPPNFDLGRPDPFVSEILDGLAELGRLPLKPFVYLLNIQSSPSRKKRPYPKRWDTEAIGKPPLTAKNNAFPNCFSR